MKLSLFDYNLPKSLIAQKQIKPRDHSRLLILDRTSHKIVHKHFYDLPDFLTANDVLVLNETKVFPARLYGQKKSGGRVEVLLVEKINPSAWQAMIGGRNLKVGNRIYFTRNLVAEIIKDIDGKTKEIKFNKSGKALGKIIEQIGHTPLPPYIKVNDNAKIKKDYQTIRGELSRYDKKLADKEEILIITGTVQNPYFNIYFNPNCYSFSIYSKRKSSRRRTNVKNFSRQHIFI